MKRFFSLWTLAILVASPLLFTSCIQDDDDDTGVGTGSTTYVDGTDAATGLPSVTVTDIGDGTGTITWTRDKVYVLDGFVFVNAGQTLTIEAGTVIKGKTGTGEQASALIVARDGKINAQGTASAPIIMTSENDQLNGNLGTTPGQWGGLIVLGNAQLNSSPGESAIEGIPTTEARGIYGGSNDNDNSGTITYVSIRHGGTDIGAGNEINGLTLGGVGAGTMIDYVEIFANADDGVEFFGGTASTKHLVSAYCGDDAVDYDEGYRGRNQFLFVYQGLNDGDRGGEHDGGTDPEDATPYATPIFMNCTYIGRGADAGKKTLTFRDNAGGEYHNSIFYGYAKGVDIELLASGESSYRRFEAGQLKLENNVFVNVAGGTGIFKVAFADGISDTGESATLDAYFTSAGNAVNNALISRASVIPTATSGTLSSPNDFFFTAVDYKGAFQPNQTAWYAGWTAVDAHIQ